MTQSRPPFLSSTSMCGLLMKNQTSEKMTGNSITAGAWFIGDNRQSLKVTIKPEPYTLDRTLRWVQRQVAPTLKMLKKIDKGKRHRLHGNKSTPGKKLTEKHEMIIKQQTTPAKDLVES